MYGCSFNDMKEDWRGLHGLQNAAVYRLHTKVFQDIMQIFLKCHMRWFGVGKEKGFSMEETLGLSTHFKQQDNIEIHTENLCLKH